MIIEVNEQKLNRAAAAVHRELAGLGLWTCQGLASSDIYLVSDLATQICVSLKTHGFVFEPGLPRFCSLVGLQEGQIYISRKLRYDEDELRPNLRDIIRHEYGHVLHFNNEGRLFTKEEFLSVFGQGESESFVSAYAQTDPAEDFAETFMYYLKGRGLGKPTDKHLAKKFRFLSKLVSSLQHNNGRTKLVS